MSAIPPSKRPRRNVALIVSICVNLLLAGIIAMAVYRFAFRPPEAPMMMSGPGFGHGLPERQQIRLILTPHGLMRVVPEKQDAIRAVLRPHHENMEKLRAETVAARQEVLRLYAAPTLDKAALDKAFARMLAADAAIEAELVKTSSDVSVLLSPEERKKVLEWQPRGHRGWREGHGNGPHGDGPRGEGPRGENPPPDDH
jgi:uncharacterized membrane protein